MLKWLLGQRKPRQWFGEYTDQSICRSCGKPIADRSIRFDGCCPHCGHRNDDPWDFYWRDEIGRWEYTSSGRAAEPSRRWVPKGEE